MPVLIHYADVAVRYHLTTEVPCLSLVYRSMHLHTAVTIYQAPFVYNWETGCSYVGVYSIHMYNICNSYVQAGEL